MTNPPPPQSIYWDPFFVAGQEISLVHLDPFEFLCPTPDGNNRRVRVVYKSHVFTRAHVEGDPLDEMCFDQRIFCPERGFLLRHAIGRPMSDQQDAFARGFLNSRGKIPSDIDLQE